MKNIVTNINGGMPFTQQTLAYMQDTYKDILKSFYQHLDIPNTGNFIIAGCVQNGTSYSQGWLIIDGELLYVAAGTGTHVKILQNEIIKTYEDNSTNINYIERYAEFTNVATGNIAINIFQRLQQQRVVTAADCTHLANRTYTYDLPKFVTTIELQANPNNTAGFLLNRINPFDGIKDGYEIIVKCKNDGAGLTYLKKNGVGNNISFIRSEHAPGGGPLITPYFGLSGFIAGFNVTTAGAGYALNLHVKLRWSALDNRWVEISRNSVTLNDFSL